MFSSLRSKWLLGIALVAIATGSSLIVTRDRGASRLDVGPFRIEPGSLRFVPGQDERGIAVTNTGDAAAPLRAIGADPWLTAEPSETELAAGATLTVTVRVDRNGIQTEASSHLRIVSGSDSGLVPVTVQVEGSGSPDGGPRLSVAGSVDLGESRLDAEVLIANAGGEPLRWEAVSGVAWLQVSPQEGEVAAGANQTLRVVGDREGLDPGDHEGAIAVSSNGGDAIIGVRMSVGTGPVLGLSRHAIDFGIHDGGSRTKTFRVLNVGRRPLSWSAAPGAPFVSLPGSSTGTIEPGGSARVGVRWNFDQAVLGHLESTVEITSDGGNGSIVVEGITDPTAPEAKDLSMDTLHEHCSGGSCDDYRHARARIVEPYSEIRSVEVEWRLCQAAGPPGTNPTCGSWRTEPMARASGEIFQADVGPLVGCIPGLSAVINYRIYTEDTLGNKGATPGNSTFQVQSHCQR